MMRVLVCGGRNYTDRAKVVEVLEELHKATPIACVIHGGARGADRFAAYWAENRKIACLSFPVVPADWEKYGRSAGPMRNARMLKEGHPDLVIAFPGGAGTVNMLFQARVARKSIMVVDAA